MIPFVNLGAQYAAYKEEVDAAVSEVLSSGNPVGGKAVADIERTLAEDANVRCAVSCASGTAALCLALKALGLQPGDEVIVPDFTFIATASAVSLLGGIPRFADVGEDFLVLPSSVEERISSRTVGIIAVDLFGQCPAYGELSNLARRHGLWILEDAAQSFGAFQNGRPAGSFGTAAATSFYPTKPFGAYGDGGAVLSNDADFCRKARILASHGKNEDGLCTVLGTNSRLDALQAAILLVKRRHFRAELAVRRKNAQIYNELFSKVPGVQVPKISAGNESVHAQYTVRCDDRKAFVEALSSAEVPTRIYYERPLSAEPFFTKYPKTREDAEGNPNAYRLSRKACSLPVCAFTDVSSIAEKIRSAL